MSTSLSKFARTALVSAASVAALACSVSSGESEGSRYEFYTEPSELQAEDLNDAANQSVRAEAATPEVMAGADGTSDASVEQGSPRADVANGVRPRLASVVSQLVFEADGKTAALTEVGARLDGKGSNSVGQEAQ